MNYRSPREEKKGSEKISGDYSENILNMGKKIVNQVQEVQSSIQDKPKEDQAKTHITQIDKNQIQRKILKSKGKSNKQYTRKSP